MAYSVIEIQPQEVVFRQGEPGQLMYLVQDGEVEVLQEIGRGEKQIAVLERGDFFGEMAVLEEEPRSHSVRALTVAKLVEIDRAGFQHMLQRNAEIAVRVIRKLSNRLASAEDMLLRAYAARDAFAQPAEDSRGGATHSGSRPEPMMTVEARLLCLSPSAELALPVKDVATIGRLDPANGIYPDVDLTPVDIQLTTSRRHARLLRHRDGFYVQEEAATNGTFVNGRRISALRPIEIRPGDSLMFGNVLTRFLVD